MIEQGSGVNVAGRIESGYVQSGESVLVLPANELASVRGETQRQRETKRQTRDRETERQRDYIFLKVLLLTMSQINGQL